MSTAYLDLFINRFLRHDDGTGVVIVAGEGGERFASRLFVALKVRGASPDMVGDNSRTLAEAIKAQDRSSARRVAVVCVSGLSDDTNKAMRAWQDSHPSNRLIFRIGNVPETQAALC